ncbi:unnamed protein product, partial [Discosporangium mesarthrocarpum]
MKIRRGMVNVIMPFPASAEIAEQEESGEHNCLYDPGQYSPCNIEGVGATPMNTLQPGGGGPSPLGTSSAEGSLEARHGTFPAGGAGNTPEGNEVPDSWFPVGLLVLVLYGPFGKDNMKHFSYDDRGTILCP